MNYLSNSSDVDAMLDALRRLSPEACEASGITPE
jgi:hypothetical protein